MKKNKLLLFLYAMFAAFFYYLKANKKIVIPVISLVIAVVLAVSFFPFDKTFSKQPDINLSDSNTASPESSAPDESSSAVSEVSSEEDSSSLVSEVSSETESSSALESASQTSSVTSEPSVSNPIQRNAVNVVAGGKSNTDPEDNDFLDAMVYSGYNLQKHRSDGLMWQYVLCADKPAKGWLSKITYGGGCSGYEKTADGKPDIARFERGGLVCASYATYVYFNYLPNVVGIDTSNLDKPERSYDANCWYIAGQKWVEKGYSRYIGFTARESGTRTVFTPNEPIPIGSLMLFTDFKNRNDHCTHICLYAGEKNGYHWVTHVGNANGPEFCAMERMSCGPDPQWPIKVITTPNGIVK